MHMYVYICRCVHDDPHALRLDPIHEGLAPRFVHVCIHIYQHIEIQRLRKLHTYIHTYTIQKYITDSTTHSPKRAYNRSLTPFQVRFECHISMF